MKQPAGIVPICASEMWERYGFYALQALFVFFFMEVYQQSESNTYVLLGTVTAVVYIFPVIGGWIGDRQLGLVHAIILGAVFLAIGYGLIGIKGYFYLYLGLTFITLGVGLFKPNMTSLLGALYDKDDPRRETGFTWYYVGINTGVVLSLWFSGLLKEYVSWLACYSVASLGIVIGLCVFLSSIKQLRINRPHVLTQVSNRRIACGYLIIAIFSAVVFAIFRYQFVAMLFIQLVGVAVVIIVVAMSIKDSYWQRRKNYAFLLVGAVSIIFWALELQIFFSINVFINRTLDHHVLGFALPTSAFLSIVPLGIVVVGMLMSHVWRWLDKHPVLASTPGKICIGLFFLVLCYAVLALSAYTQYANGQVMFVWVALALLCLAVSELFVAPIGMSMVTAVMPFSRTGFMMGVWFVVVGLGGKLAGYLAHFSTVPDLMTDQHQITDYYGHAFLIYMGLSLAAFLLSLVLIPFVRRCMNDTAVSR